MSTTTKENVIKMNETLFNALGSVVINENKRIDFLPSKFPTAFMMFENYTFNMADKIDAENYGKCSGYWQFFDCKEQPAFFIYPSDGIYTIDDQNRQCSYNIDSKLFGLITCLMTFSHVSCAAYDSRPSLSEQFAKHYHAMRNAFYNAVDELVQSDTTSDQDKEEIRTISRIVTSYLD